MVFDHFLLTIIAAAAFLFSAFNSVSPQEMPTNNHGSNIIYGKKRESDFLIMPPRIPRNDIKKFCGKPFEEMEAAFRVPSLMDTLFVDGGNVITGDETAKGLFSKDVQYVDAAVFSVEANALYVFVGPYVYEYNLTNSVHKNIYVINNKLVQNPEASARIKTMSGKEQLLVFKDGKIWIWKPFLRKMSSNDGIPAREIFPEIPDNIDAAISGENNKVYFFSEDDYYIQKAFTKESKTEKIYNFKHFLCYE